LHTLASALTDCRAVHFSFPHFSLTLDIGFDTKNSGSSLADENFHPSRVILLETGSSKALVRSSSVHFRVLGLPESILIMRGRWCPLRRPERRTLYVSRGRHGAPDTGARNFLGRHDGREGQDWFKSKPSKWSSCSRRCRRATRSRAVAL